jgi:hypothetical protein
VVALSRPKTPALVRLDGYPEAAFFAGLGYRHENRSELERDLLILARTKGSFVNLLHKEGTMKEHELVVLTGPIAEHGLEPCASIIREDEAMSTYLFSSESGSEGHPDKLADRISDTILDAFLTPAPSPTHPTPDAPAPPDRS